MTIPNKRKLHWVSDPIEDESVIEERRHRARVAARLGFQWKIGARDDKSRVDYYHSLLTRGLSDSQAYLAAYGDMGAKKTMKKKPMGIGATYRAKKKAANYGASPAFNKALVAAVKKVENRAQETVYSQGGAYMNTNAATYTTTGYSMSGLNQSAAYAAGTTTTRCNVTNAVFLWPLSPMAQVGNSNQPGYRKGQRINPVGFRYSIAHYQGLASVGATYHWALLRNKGVSLTGSYVTQPAIASTNSLSMFVPWTQGPLAASGPNGNVPNGDFASQARWNYPEWSKVKTGSWTMPVILSRENSAVTSSPNQPNAQNAAKVVTGYIPIKDAHWDYPTPTGIANIKGGDYFFVIWREGYADTTINSDAMVMTYELSFKDP